MTERSSDSDTSRAPKSPPAAGGSRSPQIPGMVPDRSTIPGHFSTRVGRATGKRRPLAQYGTAEEIMKVYKRVPEEQVVAESFEQAPASFEERRKANPADRTPVRPRPPAVAEGATPEALPAGASEF